METNSDTRLTKGAMSGAGAGTGAGAVASAYTSSELKLSSSDSVIMWFRRDLRIVDNTALEAAIATGATIIPIFIFTPTQISERKNDYKSNKSVQFMIESLVDLDAEIRRVSGGANLVCFMGEPEAVIPRIAKAFKAAAVFLNSDYTPYSKKRDSAVETALKRVGAGIEFRTHHDVCLREPGSITTGGKAYQKYTPFYMRVVAERAKLRDPINAHKKIDFMTPSPSNAVGRVSLSDAYSDFTIATSDIAVHGGRDEAEKILRSIGDFRKYGSTRNDLSVSTTGLSAYLKFGCVSVREVYERVAAVLGSSHDLIRQLIWRDFYIHLMDAFPHVIGRALKPSYDKVRWRKNERWLTAWKEGQTGFPVVDAGMRQLAETGFMHNRARMITASFLIKTLLIDWREGEQHFARSLVDYDPAANNGNWQWVAGTGADSQPYFRVFNPWLQSEKHDPDAEYIKRWVPELAGVDARDIHRWHDEKIRAKYAGRVEYVEPIVVFETQRAAVLEMYKSALK